MSSFFDLIRASVREVLIRDFRNWKPDREASVSDWCSEALREVPEVWRRPFARVQISTARARREDKALLAAWLIDATLVREVWPHLLYPCTRCGIATGNWCDLCDDVRNALCAECEEESAPCEECVREMEVNRQIRIECDELQQ